MSRNFVRGLGYLGISLAYLIGCSGSPSKPADEAGLEKIVAKAPAQEDKKPKQEVLELTRDNYRDILGLDIEDRVELDSRPPVIIKFYTDACPPCKAIELAYKEVAGRFYRKDVVFAQYKCTFNLPSRGKYYNPELPTEISIVGDWHIAGVPRMAVVYKGELKLIKKGKDLAPLGEEGGAEWFHTMVKDILKQYCGDWSYLKREMAK